ncbi:MAG: hypothetical protein H8D84_02245 [Proteobacteria bacterium]|nr:hypothetical protein [Pseudomonadota bacterium]
MALSTISGTTGITDATITSAKLADFAAAVDLNGVELLLDADQDTSITADTDDRIDFKIAGVEHISISNSSGDTIIKPMVDAKDIVFQQYDGNKILEINDGNYVAISGAAAGPGELRFYEDTDLGSHYTGFKAGNNTASVAYVLPLADGTSGFQLTTDGSGTLSWSSAGTSLANDANNRVVTGTGSGLNGEANLTFDGSTLAVTGAATVSGNLTGSGTVQGTTITATTAFVPDASDGAALGTSALEFSDLFLADAAVISLGDDDDVTLTHVADTGILINSTNVIQFNDASQNIGAPSNAILDINATDEIELNATLVDINANVEISGTATTTGVHTFTAVPVFPNNTIETADIQADAVDGTKIADDAIDSEHYADGSIDNAHIADDAIDSEHYADGSIDTAHLADGQVTIGKLATAVLTGATDIGAAIVDADLFLVDDGAGGTLRKTAASRIKTYIGDNTPMWGAYIGSDQTGLSDNTLTKGAFNTEFFDSDGAYDTSNYRFTVPSGKAGKYFITGNITFQGTSGGHGRSIYTYIYKNGSSLGKSGYFLTDNSFEGTQHNGTNVSAIYDLAVGDYIELYAQKFASGGIIISGTAASYFGGYKLI